MKRTRVMRWWAALLTLVSLLGSAGVPVARAGTRDVVLGEICSVASRGVSNTAPDHHSSDEAGQGLHCAACPVGAPALLPDAALPAPLRLPAVAVAVAVVVQRGYGRPVLHPAAPPRAPPSRFAIA